MEIAQTHFEYTLKLFSLNLSLNENSYLVHYLVRMYALRRHFTNLPIRHFANVSWRIGEI